MASMQSTSQLFWRAVFEDPKFFESIKNHSRYRLRLIAIISVDLGLFLNILSVCLARNKVLNGLAFLPLVISLVWHLFDLVSSRVYKHGMPIRLLAWVDLLGFVSFLVFLIVNGIVATNEYRTNITILMTYTSVPWMACCIIHGLIVAQFILPYPFGHLELDPVCPDCHKHWKTPSGSEETYSLIHDEDDIESHAGTATGLSEGEATARVQRQQTES